MERFNKYLSWAANNQEKAFELYALNTELSEALYTPLQMLEVVLRNRVHIVLTKKYSDRWLHDNSLISNTHQRFKVDKVVADLTNRKKNPAPGDIVAALTFGFWTSMFNNEYEILWQQTLNQIGKTKDDKGLTRKNFSGPLTKIRLLRNRIAHHEPILGYNLPNRYSEILKLIGWMSPAAEEWTIYHSRFSRVYPVNGINLSQ
ncbi:MAG: Abi family protein [Pseudomonadota bacterium]